KERELEKTRGAVDHETFRRMRREIKEASELVDKAVQQATKARAKVENAAEEAEAVGVKSSEEEETSSEESD
ncbi:MAG: hypothetical protein R3339_08930, partial [Thermodesulfobacteriota bacterium]|nr:hypothetical protein [Thermodesulfobacteriota bacterium]